MIGDAPDEEHIDPHGECRHEIHRLESALATARREALEEAEKVRPLIEWAKRVSATHATIGGQAILRGCQCGLCKIVRALLSQSVEGNKDA